MPYAVKNWQRFQHFKDRRPPWIKLYREILDKRDIFALSDRAFRVLVGCWLLASEDRTQNGILPDTVDLAFRLRMEEASVIKSLEELSEFVVLVDITTISERYHDGPPETETETEKRESQRRGRGEQRRGRNGEGSQATSSKTEESNDAAAATFFATIASRLKAPSPASTDDLEARRALLAEQARAIGATK